MRWFRRHRGSQTEAPTPVARLRINEPSVPTNVWLVFADESGRYTARQILTAVLTQNRDRTEQLDIPALVDEMLLGLQAGGLEIVQSGDVE